MSKNCGCSHGKSNNSCRSGGCDDCDHAKDISQQWFYYADSNGDDLQMIIREIKDPLFTPIAYVGSKTGFTSSSLIFRRFLALMGISYIPVADGYADPVDSSENLNQGILDSPIPIQTLGDTLWGAADTFLPPPANAFPLSQYPSHILLRKALLRALRTKKKFNLRITGPATDAALDLAANGDLDLAAAIGEIRILAGSIDVAGNLFTVPTNTLGDFNIYLDPQAFVDVMAIAKQRRIPINMIAHDATDMCPITREYFDSSLREATFVTPEGKAIGLFFENVRASFGDATFFNDAGTPGGGFFQWDAHTSRLDEITSWELNHYSVETKPLVSYSGWIHRASPDVGYPLRVGMTLDCQLFRQRWKPIFDRPYVAPIGQLGKSIESEPLSVSPKCSSNKGCGCGCKK